jgi:hypothetical protein
VLQVLSPSDGLARIGRGYFVLGFPRGMTAVIGGVGRSELPCLGGELSFLGFFTILLLRWSPLAMTPPDSGLWKLDVRDPGW